LLNVKNISGYTLMALSMFLYSLCEALEKYLISIYQPQKIIFFRSAIALFFALWITFQKGITAFKPNKGLHLLRNLFAAASLFLTIYSLKHLPLSSYSFMSFTSPIFISIFSYLFLNEKLSSSVLIPILLSFGGILIMSYPFKDTDLNLGFIFAFLSSIFYALACVTTKRISHIDSFVLYASYVFVCFLIAGIFSIDDMNLRIIDLPLFILIALIHFLAFQCLIFAYRNEYLVKLSPLEYSTVIWSAILGFIIWQHLPSFKEIIGGVFILIGSIVIKRKELKTSFINAIRRLK